MNSSGQRLLAICPIGIGNFLLLAPALDHLKKSRPEVHLTLLSLKKGIGSIAERFPFIDDVIEINAGKKMSPFDKFAFFGKLYNRFDESYAFFPSNRMEYNLLPFMIRAKSRFSFRYARYGFRTLSFLNTVLVPVAEKTHDLVQNFRLLEQGGIIRPDHLSLLRFPLAESEIHFADEYLSTHHLRNSKLIGIHPGSSAEHGMDKKRWSPDGFAALAHLLSKDGDYRFLIFGGPEESAIKQETANHIGPLATVVQTHSLFETAALIGRCHRFLSNDSGLMHIAASLKVKTCGIFGPTDDTRTAPYGEGHLVIRQSMNCCPCWTLKNVGKREACQYDDFRCLAKLSLSEVFEKVKPWIA